MNSHVFWYVARGSGLLAWLLLSASIILGLFAATRLTGRRYTPASLQRVHQRVSEVTMAFVAVHIFGLVADSYVHFGVADVLVPFASHWRPAAVAFGVIAAWLLVAVLITSWLRDKLPRRMWHAIHMSSYVAYVLTTIHLMTAGTDAWARPVEATNIGIAALVTGLTGLALVRSQRRRPPGAVVPRTGSSRAVPVEAGRDQHTFVVGDAHRVDPRTRREPGQPPFRPEHHRGSGIAVGESKIGTDHRHRREPFRG